MKNDKLSKILQDLGLSEHEARVYLASLSLGPSTILKIALAAEIKRTTAYSVVESLKMKGLINVELRGLKKLLAAEDPESLQLILETRRIKLNEALPEFSALYNLKGGESFIKYHQGLAGVKTVYENILKDIKRNDDYLVLSNMDQWLNTDKEYFQEFVVRAAKKNDKVRVLLQDSPSAQKYKSLERNHNQQIKILSAKTRLTTNLIIIPQRIIIHQMIPPVMAIVIENKSAVQMHKEMFEIMWQAIPEITLTKT